jgi:hypothetical protein
LRTAVVVTAATLLLSGPARAQFFQPELRLDVIGPTPVSIEPGIGANARLGHYVRVGAVAGYDVARVDVARGPGRRWRGEVIGRFTLDPFRQQRWALSIGGGITYRRSQAYLAALADLEGPEVRGLLPALQVGVSGGVRAGVILRRAIRGRR